WRSRAASRGAGLVVGAGDRRRVVAPHGLERRDEAGGAVARDLLGRALVVIVHMVDAHRYSPAGAVGRRSAATRSSRAASAMSRRAATTAGPVRAGAAPAGAAVATSSPSPSSCCSRR